MGQLSRARAFFALFAVGGLLVTACGDGGGSSDPCREGDETCETVDACEGAYDTCVEDAASVLSICWDAIQSEAHDSCTASGTHLGCSIDYFDATGICFASYEQCALPGEVEAGGEGDKALRACEQACRQTAHDCHFAAHDAGCTPAGVADCDSPFEECIDACSAIADTCGDGVIQTDEACDAGEVGDPGCQDCGVVFSYLCSGTPSVCSKTGLAEDLVLATGSEDDALAFCEWFVGILGGEGARRTCGTDDVVYTTRPASSCAVSIRNLAGGCTVGELEAWAGEHSGACGVLLGSDPDCVTNDPDVTIVDAGNEEDPTPTPDYSEETAGECLWWNEQTDDCSLCMATAGCEPLGWCSVGADGEACTSCWEAGDPSACREISTINDLRRYGLAFCDAECHDEKNLCDISDSQDSCTTCLEESCCEEFAECTISTCSSCWEDGDCFSWDTAFEEMHACATEHCDGCVPGPLL